MCISTTLWPWVVSSSAVLHYFPHKGRECSFFICQREQCTIRCFCFCLLASCQLSFNLWQIVGGVCAFFLFYKKQVIKNNLFTKFPKPHHTFFADFLVSCKICLITVIRPIEVLLLSAHLHLHWSVFNINVSAACSDRRCDLFLLYFIFFSSQLVDLLWSFISCQCSVLFRKYRLFLSLIVAYSSTCRISAQRKNQKSFPKDNSFYFFFFFFFHEFVYPMKTVLIAWWLYFNNHYFLSNHHFYGNTSFSPPRWNV